MNDEKTFAINDNNNDIAKMYTDIVQFCKYEMLGTTIDLETRFTRVNIIFLIFFDRISSLFNIDNMLSLLLFLFFFSKINEQL